MIVDSQLTRASWPVGKISKVFPEAFFALQWLKWGTVPMLDECHPDLVLQQVFWQLL